MYICEICEVRGRGFRPERKRKAGELNRMEF
jgi:hypothetical protein